APSANRWRIVRSIGRSRSWSAAASSIRRVSLAASASFIAGSNLRSIIDVPLACRYGRSSAPPETASRNCFGSTPSPSASAMVSAVASTTDDTQALATSLSLLPAPASPTQRVLFPIASNRGSTAARTSSGPEASTTGPPVSAAAVGPSTGAAADAAGGAGLHPHRVLSRVGQRVVEGLEDHVGVGQHGDHGVGTLDRLALVVAERHALVGERFHLVAAAIPGPHLETGAGQVARHGLAHQAAGAQERDAADLTIGLGHGSSFRRRRPRSDRVPPCLVLHAHPMIG